MYPVFVVYFWPAICHSAYIQSKINFNLLFILMGNLLNGFYSITYVHVFSVKIPQLTLLSISY